MIELEAKSCQNCKKSFIIEPEDFAFYQKINVPPPTWCPECRYVRRSLFWNNRYLFRKKDARTGQEIFSGYPEESPIKIYERDYWWSDAFDASGYARDYDFSRNFFEQLHELMYDVPWPSRSVLHLTNSDYCNQVGELKNCYLLFDGDTSENCAYGGMFFKMKDSLDFYMIGESELCYEVFSAGSCYETFFCNELSSCRHMWFSMNCVGCSNCIGCVNLRNQQYQIFNKQYTKEGYEVELKKMNLGSYHALQVLKQKAEALWKKSPMKYMHDEHNVNVSGDYIYHSKNAQDCYIIANVEDSRFVAYAAREIKDSYDYTNWGNRVELMYEVIVAGINARNCKFCFECWPACQNLEYCINCHSSSNCFGCVGLKKNEYCIFNKQYSKEEYEILVSKIREQMESMPYIDFQGRRFTYGEFFPIEFSPIAYNESLAMNDFPMTKEEAMSQGLTWRDSRAKEFQTTLHAENFPDHINDVTEEIIKEVIRCIGCTKAYRIIPMEFAFYKRFQLPIPRHCPECRFQERAKFKNSPKLFNRECDYCSAKILTGYSPDRPEPIYCDGCYKKEVV